MALRYNGGRGAITCDECRVILQIGTVPGDNVLVVSAENGIYHYCIMPCKRRTYDLSKKQKTN